MLRGANVVRVISRHISLEEIFEKKSGNTQFYPAGNDRVLPGFSPKFQSPPIARSLLDYCSKKAKCPDSQEVAVGEGGVGEVGVAAAKQLGKAELGKVELTANMDGGGLSRGGRSRGRRGEVVGGLQSGEVGGQALSESGEVCVGGV